MLRWFHDRQDWSLEGITAQEIGPDTTFVRYELILQRHLLAVPSNQQRIIRLLNALGLMDSACVPDRRYPWKNVSYQVHR